MARLFSLARNAAAAIAIGVLLTGCLVPETIDANIVLEGYEYDMRVETRLAAPRVVKALADGHVFTEQEEDRMRAEEREAARMPALRVSPMLGKGALISSSISPASWMQAGPQLASPTRGRSRKPTTS